MHAFTFRNNFFKLHNSIWVLSNKVVAFASMRTRRVNFKMRNPTGLSPDACKVVALSVEVKLRNHRINHSLSWLVHFATLVQYVPLLFKKLLVRKDVVLELFKDIVVVFDAIARVGVPAELGGYGLEGWVWDSVEVVRQKGVVNLGSCSIVGRKRLS